ncbi:3-phosphoshikimate 1-carboxyvinyltransferase [Thermosulfidibacter takaii]|nr:3-phosphoshikimate 1-carboxyvinyltransferase [Thermosulfidibacter takaii]
MVEPLRKPFAKRMKVPADKSLTHRAFMLAALADGVSEVLNPLMSEDCMSTKKCLEMCGVEFQQFDNGYLVKGGSIKEPEDVLHAGNSGTTARLLMGLLAGYDFAFVITGDGSLRRRPMDRVLEPLSQMGLTYIARDGGRYLPVAAKGGSLKGISYRSRVASAQVKSAIILAGLHAEGRTEVEEPFKSRDHTERMLKALGADIVVEGLRVMVRGGQTLSSFKFEVPGDPSSAAFWVALGVLLRGSEVVIEDVLLNPTRIGFFESLKRMGADIEWQVKEERMNEPVGWVKACYSPNLKAIEVKRNDIPYMIDEIPLLALVAAFAEGETVITGASELRVKESDRIKATVSELSKLGADIEELEDGMVIRGPSKLKVGTCWSYRDHRIAMMLAVAGAVSEKGVEIEEAEWVSISYPDFFEELIG